MTFHVHINVYNKILYVNLVYNRVTFMSYVKYDGNLYQA